MKYCSKCGNELHDDAVICPKCGCPVEAKQSSNKTSNSKIRTALLLNIFAFVIALFSIVNYCYEVSKSDNNNDSTYILLFGLLALITLSFILCIIINAFARKGEIKSFLAWSYVVSVVITTNFLCFTRSRAFLRRNLWDGHIDSDSPHSSNYCRS